MNRNVEPAEALLTMEPAERFALAEDGFVGSLYRPEQDLYPGKVMIMVGGSDGSYALTRLVAEQFVKRGLTVMALAYWNYPGLPERYERIPIETVEKAARRLKENGYAKAGLWGISMGAELVLIAGSLLQDLVSCVVAVCPINICGQGLDKGKGKLGLLDCSAWSFRGKELDYMPLALSKGQIVKDSLKQRGLCMRSCYEDAVKKASEEARIKVEHINGPVLFLSAKHDGMWPAAEAAEAMMRRLDDKRFPYLHQHYCYEYASHFLLPYKLKSVRLFAIERKYPDRCMKSNLDSFEKTLNFLKMW